MKKCVQDSVRKYFVVCGILGIVLVSLWIIICFATQSYIVTVVTLLIMLLFMKVAIRIIANKTLLLVLLKNLDADGFQEIVNDSRFRAPLIYRTSAAVSSGDYQTAINIASKQLSEKKTPIRLKHYYLSLLARAYFELRDFEKLNILIAKYQEYQKQFPSKSFLRTPNSAWNYYKRFLEHNYEACKTVCEKRNLQFRSKAWDSKLRKLQNNFFFAVACYENGEFYKAKGFFESIICFAPQMNYATLSKKYLIAIEQERPISLFDAEVLPDTNFQIYDNKTQARIRKYKLVKRMGVAIISILLLASYVPNKENSNINIFEKNLNQAATLYYEDAVVLDYFNLYKDEVFVDSLGLIGENNCIHLVEIVSDDNGRTVDIFFIEENIDLDKYYCVKSPASNYYIGFVLSQSVITDTDTYYVRELAIKHDNYWFNIDYVETSSNKR